jgi:hypothetical protein
VLQLLTSLGLEKIPTSAGNSRAQIPIATVLNWTAQFKKN